MKIDRSITAASDLGLRRLVALGLSSARGLSALPRLLRARTADAQEPAPAAAPQPAAAGRGVMPTRPQQREGGTARTTDAVRPRSAQPAAAGRGRPGRTDSGDTGMAGAGMADIPAQPTDVAAPLAMRPETAMLPTALTPTALTPTALTPTAARAPVGLADLRAALDVPVLHQSPERAQLRTVADGFSRLARDGDCAEVLHGLRDLDQTRAAAADGTRLAGAAVDGVLRSMHQALASHDFAMARTHLECFEAMFADHPGDYPAAVLLARAQIDYGWALRGPGCSDEVAPEDWDGLLSHTARAQEVLAGFDPVAEGSALLAATRYLLIRGIADADRVVDGWYADWLALDPDDADTPLTHGQYVTPQWYGVADEDGDFFPAFDRAARAAAARTGAMAYAMHYNAATEHWPDALAGMDLDLLIEGLADYCARTGCQVRANRAAQILWQMLQSPCLGGADRAAPLRAALAEVVQGYVGALHLDCWRDEAQAMAALGALFATEVALGARIVPAGGGMRSVRA